MAFFTKISDDDIPSITIDPSQTIAKINPNIYSGFTEHMGRCVYGGIYDPGNPLSDENGFRKDVLEALRELNIPLIRYPGGNFCATYHWLDGVGPKEKRPSRPELAWLGTETNQFGTDEFLKWCEVLGTEAYLCLNFGTGTLDEALGWVEYCNGTGDTYYANLRRQNGHEKPYKVKYWALGNEMWGPWQINQMTATEYSHQAFQWAKALKLLDPTLKLILCGSDGLQPWDYTVLTSTLTAPSAPLSSTPPGYHPLISMHSIHMYTSSHAHLPNAFAPLAAEHAITLTSALIDHALITNRVPLHDASWRPQICFDEWNVWDPARAEGSKGAEEKYTLSDALAVGVWLNVFVRQAGKVGMACLAQSVNVISPLMTVEKTKLEEGGEGGGGGGVVKQTTWWPLWLFSRYMRGETVGVGVKSGVWDVDRATEPAWLSGMRELGWLDVSAAVDRESGWCSAVVVNLCAERGWSVDLKSVGSGEGEVVVWTVTGRGIEVTNMDGVEDEVVAKEGRWDGKGRFEFPKHSLTMLRWRI